jgi:hypothetical protein
MSVTITNLRRATNPGNAWVVGWSTSLDAPGDPPVTCYVYRDGVQIASTVARSIVVAAAPGAGSPVIEIFDAAADRPASVHPRRATLTWTRALSATPAVASYRVEEQAPGSSDWTLRAVITPAPDQTYFVWTSGVLPDGLTTAFRVTPASPAGNDGTALAWSCLMVRIPDPPDVRFAYAAPPGTGRVTISAP